MRVSDVRQCREWGTMAAVGCRLPPWLVGAWFTCFYLDTLRVMCPPSKKSCHLVQKNLCVLHFTQIKPLQKNDQLYLHEKDTSTKNVNCNEIGECEQNTIECSNKFVRPKLTKLEICFPALMQVLAPYYSLQLKAPYFAQRDTVGIVQRGKSRFPPQND